MTHRWAMHQGLPALSRNRHRGPLFTPEAPRWPCRLKGVICVFSRVFWNYSLGDGGLPGSLGPCNGRKISVQSLTHKSHKNTPDTGAFLPPGFKKRKKEKASEKVLISRRGS